ncbi:MULTISPECIES: helix-turn-helix domain-containing protein [Paracoccus]|uniref:helix-turn-helix domain-containing protein n=1 Tax=Paracoccus TaxID=265 RepID=UPI000FDB5938|nr:MULTISPECIES: helix-turn-helix transcriptional regulator [Paracoccus]AZY92269.1 XRE family transcriptional regulator [Paracoccus sp. Arc7-R13]TNB89649.1 helix-turn-helix transcriptional regulator [Paracoccus marcusii]
MTDRADALLSAFAIVLRRHRLAAGMTQEELAHKAGVSPRYVSLLETRKYQPTLATVDGIALALGMPLAAFVAEIETEHAAASVPRP